MGTADRLRAFGFVALLVGLLGLLPSSLLQADDAGTPVELYSNTSDGPWRSANGRWLAQSFATGDEEVEVTSLRVWWRATDEGNSSASASSYSLEIRSSSSDEPDTLLRTVVTDQTVSPWADEFNTVTLDPPLSLAANQNFFVVMRGAASGTIGWKCGPDSPSTDLTSPPSFVALESTSGASGSWGPVTSPCAGRQFSMVVAAETRPATTTTTTTIPPRPRRTTTTSTSTTTTTTTTTTSSTTTFTTDPPISTSAPISPTRPPSITTTSTPSEASTTTIPSAESSSTTSTTTSLPLVETTSPPTTTPDSNPTPPPSGPTNSEAAIFGIGDRDDVIVKIDAVPGQPSAGTEISVRAVNLQPSSAVTLTLFSEPTRLLSGMADDEGTFSGIARIPDGLDPGAHTVVIEAIGVDDDVEVAGAFSIDDRGAFEEVIQPRTVTDLAGPDDPRIDRALESGRPLWDPRSKPATSALITVTAMTMIALAGAGGISSRGLSTNQSRPTPSNAETSQGQRDENSRGKLAGVVTKKLKGLNIESSARGDLSGTWAVPGVAVADRFSCAAPNVVGSYSAAGSRILVDGAWLRAIFGTFGYTSWLIGAILGVLASTVGGQSPLAPAAAWLATIVALGILDAGAGAAAWLAIAIWAGASGAVTSWFDIRTLLGLFVLLATPALLAHVIRPLRRSTRGNRFETWERVFDYLMMPVFVAFATGSMLKALNGLSGLELVSNADISIVRWVVWLSIMVRLGAEDVASLFYPERMKCVQPTKLTSPNRRVTTASIVLRSLTFLMVCEPFFGVSGVTISAAVLLAIPNVLKMWEDDLPNSSTLNKWFPRGLFRFLCTLVLGAYLSSRLLGAGDDDAIRSSFIWLLLPGVAIGVVEMFGRQGGTWPNVALRRTLGAFVWLGAAGIVTGQITVFG